MRSLLVVVSLILCSIAHGARAAEIYVSPSGNDSDPGTRDKPLQTFAAAKKAASVQVRAEQRPVTLWFRGGTYYLPETVTFTPDDSGTQASPITYAAAGGETVVISGGSKLQLHWKPYQDGIYQADVPNQEGQPVVFDQLFVNGQSQPLARYPNYDPKGEYFNGSAADAISPERVARWKDPKGGFIHALHEAMWGGSHYVITGKDSSGKLTYEGGWQNNRPSGMHAQYRFVENIFEELDAPGEWFLNAKTHTLYFYPPNGLDLEQATFEAVRLRQLIEFQGSEQHPICFVKFQDLTFRHAARTFMENREPLLRSDWTTYRGGALLFTGTEDCMLEDCFLDQLGGNAVFVNQYNRRLTVRGCHIANAGANGVAFVGDPKAVRNPLFRVGQTQDYAKIDKKPGPQSNNYPADCLVDDCLIYRTGRIEKQTSPIEISMSERITVRHCSLYDVPRAGINIGDGCWGGHVIEFCDVFDTVKETGDHGSFNSWGRDRYWELGGVKRESSMVVEGHDLPRLDAVEPVILRNNRWRCDHGWDIDLDDGSSNFEIYNNLCLNGGLKNREGFYRICSNNVIVNNSFHPHVWFSRSADVFSHNIVCRPYAPIGMPPVWGREVDNNLLHIPGLRQPVAATSLQKSSGRDQHSLEADAMFLDPAHGDYRVADTSPALKLGFVNFPMDKFGVQKPELRVLAHTPKLPALEGAPEPEAIPLHTWMGATAKTVSTLGEVSAAGLPEQAGALLLEVPEASQAAKLGLQKLDVIRACNGQATKTVEDLLRSANAAAGVKLELDVWRGQKPLKLTLTDYVFVVSESRADADFKSIPLATTSPVAIQAIATEPRDTANDPLSSLTDGHLTHSYGPIFSNGVKNGKYKLDLGSSRRIAQVNTWSFNLNGHRGCQRFTLFGSDAPEDPGFDVDDAKKFTRIAEVDTSGQIVPAFGVTSIRREGGKSLGTFHWLIWSTRPADNGENTAFQEMQVMEAADGK